MIFALYTYTYFPILIICILLAALLYFKKDTPFFLKLFLPFLTATLMVSLIGYRMAQEGKNNHTLSNVYSVIEYVLYFVILHQIIQNRRIKKIIFHCTWIYSLLAIINISLGQGIGVFHSFTYSIGAIIIVSICIYYFYQLNRKASWEKAFGKPKSWICCGLLFYYGGTLPLYGATNFLKDYPPVFLDIYALIILILNCLLYALFNIAFVCFLRYKQEANNSG